MKNGKLSFCIAFALASILFFACKENNTGGANNGGSNLTYSVLQNISYGAHARQVMDIYLPAKRDKNTRLVLVIHGGAWSQGNKEDMTKYVNLIKKEWPEAAIANMNYRRASNTDSIHHPQMMDDIKNAIAHLRDSRNKYVFSDSFALVGASAGGQLAMIYAYCYNHAKNIKCVGDIFGPSKINDWSWYNSFNPWLGKNIKDVLTEYVGQTWDSTAYANVSPLSNVTLFTPPTIIFHGSLDPIVPVYQSQWLNGALRTKGVNNEYHEYPAFHSFDATQSLDVTKRMVSFFKTYCK